MASSFTPVMKKMPLPSAAPPTTMVRTTVATRTIT
jgi:hypothetical protein